MKTNAKAKVSHHIKNIHHVTKRTHELFKNSKICNYTNALLLILILSIAILATQMFLNNQNKIAPEAEIRFSELSKDKKILGTIMPASCESGISTHNDCPPPSLSGYFNVDTFKVGYKVTYTWSSVNASQCVIYKWNLIGGIWVRDGDFVNLGATNGSMSLFPTNSISYQLYCKGEYSNWSQRSSSATFIDYYCGDYGSPSYNNSCTCANGNGKTVKKIIPATSCGPFDPKCVRVSEAYWCEAPVIVVPAPVVNIEFK